MNVSFIFGSCSIATDYHFDFFLPTCSTTVGSSQRRPIYVDMCLVDQLEIFNFDYNVQVACVVEVFDIYLL